MKNYWFVLLAVLIGFASCEKSKVDQRDAFVGTYEYVTEGEMTFGTFVPGIDPTLPLDTEGTYKISKLGDKDTVLISEAIDGKLDPFKAVVKGNKLEFVQDEFGAKSPNFEVVLTIDNKIAVLENDTLSWEADNVLCVGKFLGITIEGEGYVTMKSTKKALK